MIGRAVGPRSPAVTGDVRSICRRRGPRHNS